MKSRELKTGSSLEKSSMEVKGSKCCLLMLIIISVHSFNFHILVSDTQILPICLLHSSLTCSISHPYKVQNLAIMLTP
jgi:hypothetical protein